MTFYDDLSGNNIDAARRTALAWENATYEIAPKLADIIEIHLQKTLIRYAEEAMDETGEYATDEAAPLRARLLRNLNAGDEYSYVHVKINRNTLDEEVLFDEEYAGTSADFERARYFSLSTLSRTQAQRLAAWTYGIYIPTVEEGGNPRYNLPSYSDVIERRLRAWGTDKAPYWYFINYGVTGGYPNFSGTYFVQRFRGYARSYLDGISDQVFNEMDRMIADAVDEAFSSETIERIPYDVVFRIFRRAGRTEIRPVEITESGRNLFLSGIGYIAL